MVTTPTKTSKPISAAENIRMVDNKSILSTAPCLDGVVGYHASLTHWRSPVRVRVQTLFALMAFWANIRSFLQQVFYACLRPETMSTDLTVPLLPCCW